MKGSANLHNLNYRCAEQIILKKDVLKDMLMKKNWLIVILLILSFAVIGCGKNAAPLSLKDFEIEKVKIGQNIKEVIASSGNPKETIEEENIDYSIFEMFGANFPRDNIKGHKFKNLEVITDSRGNVVFILPGKPTPRGIDSTSKSKDLINIYGKNFKKEEKAGMDLYRYELVTDEKIHVFGFLVNKKSDKIEAAGVW